MKIRKGFVSNFSSSSFTCDICHETESGWWGTLGRFKNFLQYKASISGLNFKLINEAYTSQTNCLTGKREFNSDLDIRDVEVIKDIFIDRDLNSAVNIFKRYNDKWTIHLQDLLNLDKMYMNNNSCLYMTNL